METIQKIKKTKLKYLLLIFLISLPTVSAHFQKYHNYAGGNSGFYILLSILVAALIFYEKLGDTYLGYSILWSGILIPIYVDLFFPLNDEITQGIIIGIIVIIIVVFGYNYRRKILK